MHNRPSSVRARRAAQESAPRYENRVNGSRPSSYNPITPKNELRASFPRRSVGAKMEAVTPLTPRCCTLRALFKGPFSHGEKDRMRGDSAVRYVLPMPKRPCAKAGCAGSKKSPLLHALTMGALSSRGRCCAAITRAVHNPIGQRARSTSLKICKSQIPRRRRAFTWLSSNGAKRA